MKNKILPLFLLVFVLVAVSNINAQITYVDLEINQPNVENCLTSINNHELIEGLTIYPNPTEGVFNISFDNSIESRKAQIIIHNIQGQEIYNEKVIFSDNQIEYRVNLTGQPGGIYVLKVFSEKCFTTKEIIIK